MTSSSARFPKGSPTEQIQAIWDGRAAVEVVQPTAAWFLADARGTFPPLTRQAHLARVRGLARRGWLPHREAERFEQGLDAALEAAWATMERSGLGRACLEGSPPTTRPEASAGR